MDKGSKSLSEIKKKLSRERKQVSEDLIKEKLNKKKLDYDTVSLILEVFNKSKLINIAQLCGFSRFSRSGGLNSFN